MALILCGGVWPACVMPGCRHSLLLGSFILHQDDGSQAQSSSSALRTYRAEQIESVGVDPRVTAVVLEPLNWYEKLSMKLKSRSQPIGNRMNPYATADDTGINVLNSSTARKASFATARPTSAAVQSKTALQRHRYCILSD